MDPRLVGNIYSGMYDCKQSKRAHCIYDILNFISANYNVTFVAFFKNRYKQS